jgi:hypothetical protein
MPALSTFIGTGVSGGTPMTANIMTVQCPGMPCGASSSSCFVVTCTCNAPNGQFCQLEFNFKGAAHEEVFVTPITSGNQAILTSSLISCVTTPTPNYIIATSTDPTVVTNSGGNFNEIGCGSSTTQLPH